MSGSNRGAHSLIAFGTPDIARTVDVPAVRLDDYLADNDGRVDLVKIDTEGAEGFILAGMQETLRRNPKSRLVLEYIPFKLEESGYPAEKFMGLLRPHGFRFAEIDEESAAVRPVAEGDVLAANFPAVRRCGLTNLFLDR